MCNTRAEQTWSEFLKETGVRNRRLRKLPHSECERSQWRQSFF